MESRNPQGRVYRNRDNKWTLSHSDITSSQEPNLNEGYGSISSASIPSGYAEACTLSCRDARKLKGSVLDRLSRSQRSRGRAKRTNRFSHRLHDKRRGRGCGGILVERGKLDWETPVETILPEFGKL